MLQLEDWELLIQRSLSELVPAQVLLEPIALATLEVELPARTRMTSDLPRPDQSPDHSLVGEEGMAAFSSWVQEW